MVLLFDIIREENVVRKCQHEGNVSEKRKSHFTC
ncbi:hypothetical protein QF028_001036 [Neobacillus sp. B4I6]|jgi:hypothetical protein